MSERTDYTQSQKSSLASGTIVFVGPSSQLVISGCNVHNPATIAEQI